MAFDVKIDTFVSLTGFVKLIVLWHRCATAVTQKTLKASVKNQIPLMNKAIFFILIFIYSAISLYGQGKRKISKSITPDIGILIFMALKSNIDKEFAKLIPTKQEVLDYRLAGIEATKRAKMKSVFEKANEIEESLNETIKLYRKAIIRGNKLGINWNNITLEKVVYDTIFVKGVENVKGTIYFKDNKEHYVIRFADLVIFGNRITVNYLFMPYKNPPLMIQTKCIAYKDQYIKKCIYAQKFSPIKHTIPSKESCLCSFNKIILWDNCEKILTQNPVLIVDGGCFK